MACDPAILLDDDLVDALAGGGEVVGGPDGSHLLVVAREAQRLLQPISPRTPPNQRQ